MYLISMGFYVKGINKVHHGSTSAAIFKPVYNANVKHRIYYYSIQKLSQSIDVTEKTLPLKDASLASRCLAPISDNS